MLIKYLVMTFKTQGGDKATLSVEGIREDLTAEDASDEMNVIIAKDGFVSKGGKLIGKYNAQIITRNVDQIEMS
jgi:hypothetical protein